MQAMHAGFHATKNIYPAGPGPPKEEVQGRTPAVADSAVDFYGPR